jgi:hypothetical protein
MMRYEWKTRFMDVNGFVKIFIAVEHAKCSHDAGVKFIERLDAYMKAHPTYIIVYGPVLFVRAADGVYTKMLEQRVGGERWGDYRITRASDREGKRRKKKWKVRRMSDQTIHYFSSKEKAARWVVLDA